MGLVLDIFLICVVCSLIFLIGLLIYWGLSPSNPNNAAKISFKSFEQFYSINPKRWKLNDDYVECILPDKSKYGFFSDRTEKFYFNFFDYQKYKKFLKKVKQDKNDAKNMKVTAEMLNAVKQDIANMENLAQQQKKQAIDNITSILNNL